VKKSNENSNPFELHTERIATTSHSGKRVYLYPAFVKGIFRNSRSIVYAILIVIFLGLPWLQINGHPAILLDIAHRRFSIFGLTFWAHEAPILILVLLSFVLSIGLLTAVLGRVWCGWGCPQTVFIDSVFRRIEEWLEGVGLSRKHFDEQKPSLKKYSLKGLKWFLFFIASLIITHSFLAYFVGAKNVLAMMTQSPTENLTSFLVVVISTAIILFDFGWFREQFCIIACPYGRFQSVLMDEDSIVVAYDHKRGEPRKQDRNDTDFKGDCINCYRCVQVCPTGIDIRRGTQLECIMCTACIDACDDVMTKIGKEPGLVRYDSENALKGKKTAFIRPRTIIYSLLLTIVLSALFWMVSHRNMLPTYVARSTNPPYVVLENNRIQNQFTIRIHNQYFHPVTATLALEPESSQQGISLITPLAENQVEPGKSSDTIAFIQFPNNLLENGRSSLAIKLISTVKNNLNNTKSGSKIKNVEVVLIGPRN